MSPASSLEVKDAYGGTFASYQYDAFNRLVYRYDSVAATTWGYDEGINPQLEATSQFALNGLTHRYLWSDQVDELLADEQRTGSSWNTLWALSDHQGTVKDLLDYNPAGAGTSTIANSRLYDAFGNLELQTGTATTPIGYTGKYYDQATGLQNSWNRWYSPKMGRFISQDPIGFAAGDANLYRYVGNGATNATDPSGLDTIWIEGVEFYLPDGWDKEKYVKLLRTDPYIAELARVKNQPEYRGPVIQAATGPELTAEEKDLEYRFQLLEMGWLNNAGKTKLYNDSRSYLHNKLSEQAGLCWFSKWSTDIQFGVTNEGQAIATLIQPRPGLRWKTVPIGTSGVKYPVRGPAPKESVSIFKAPQPGKGQTLLNDGFRPKDFPDGGPYADGKAYFAKERGLAEQYSGYGEGILEVQIPKTVYDTRLKPLEKPYLSDPRYTEIPVPHSEFDVLNNAKRTLHDK